MIPDFKTYISESAWGDMRKRSSGEIIRKEDELSSEEKRQFISWYLRPFSAAIVLYDKYENSLDDFKKMFNSHKKLQIPTENKIGEMAYLISNWNDGDNIQQQVNDDIKKLEKVFPPEFKKEPGKSIHKTLLDWWNTLDTEKKKDIVYNVFENSEYQNELFDEYGDDVDEYDDKTLDTIWNQEIAYHEQAEYYLEYHKTNESTWGEMRKRSSGEIIRKEDDIDLLDIDGLYDYIATHYKQSAKGDAFGRKWVKVNDETLSVPVLMDYSGRNLPQTLYLSIKCLNTETYISISPALKNWAPNVYDLLKYHFTFTDVIKKQGNVITSHYIKIKPKDGSGVTNTFFISLIDFLLERVKDEKICKLIEKI